MTESAVNDLAAWQLCREHRPQHLVQWLFMTLDSGPDLRGQRRLREFLCILSERFAIVDARLSDNREIYALLGSETGGAEQIVA